MNRRILALALTGLLATGLGGASAQAATGPWYQLFQAINTVRRAHGLRPVVPSPRLHRIARAHSADMVARDYFAHTSPTGSTVYDRIVQSGFVTYGAWTAGETLAWGTGWYGTPAGVVSMWMHSPDHRAILLSPSYRFIGIGRAQGRFLGYPGADVWTADWGHR